MKAKNPKRSPHFDLFKPVIELFPRKFPSHKLTKENTLNGLMPTDQGVIEQNTFFNKIGHVVKSGWKLRGYTNAPYRRGDNQYAVVFEKLTPSKADDSMFGDLDSGIYWNHATPYTLIYDPEIYDATGKIRSQNGGQQ